MKIGIDARPLCVPTFGIGRYLQALLERFVKEPDIEWFLYADRPLLESPHLDQVITRTWPAANQALSLHRTQFGFARLAARDGLDLFFSPRHHLPLPLTRRVPTVVTIHDLVWKRFPATMLGRNRLMERALMPASLRRADRIIAVSEATRNDIAADFPAVADKIVVVHEAADPVSAVPPGGGDPYFVFLGTLEPRKNLARLIEAFAAARTELDPATRLVVIGAQGWKTRIDELVCRYDCASAVDVVGHVDDEALHRYLAGAIALCLPSLYEGFGLPALEAMQHGTPVIGSNVSSVPEVVGAGGLLVDPTSVRAIADAMVQLADDVTLRERLSLSAIDQSSRFSWDRAAAQTLAVFREVASAGATER